MTETRNEQQPHSFRHKLGDITYTVKVHFSKDIGKNFKDRVQKLIINQFFYQQEETLTKTIAAVLLK